MSRAAGLSSWLACSYALLLVYASLYPFVGDFWPAGAGLGDILSLPWPPWRDRFDEWANRVGYLPFGAAVFVATSQRMARPWRGIAAVALVAGSLSYVLEVTQHLIDGRHPSLRDWVNNLIGALAGGLLAWLSGRRMWGRRRPSAAWRDWQPDSSAGFVLLALWPLALVFPAPLPFASGHLTSLLREGVLSGFVPAADWAQALLTSLLRPPPISPFLEFLTSLLGLLAPVLVAGAAGCGGAWHRWTAAALSVVAIAVSSLSTALNFGPEHALAWWTPSALWALLAVVLVGMLWLHRLSARASAALSLLLLAALLALVWRTPQDAYFFASLQAWEQGRFIRFHGLAQWIGALWPYAALVWVSVRLSAPGPARRLDSLPTMLG
jgi:VanZ family protein